jgi:integrase/recombinase XerD
VDYHKKIELYFELKGTPDSSRESYRRRMKAFVSFMEKENKRFSDTTEEDIQQYILFLKQVKGLTPGATHSLEDGMDPVYIQQMLGHKILIRPLAICI